MLKTIIHTNTIIILFIILTTTVSHAKPPEHFTINPVIKEFDSTFSNMERCKIYVETVTDTSHQRSSTGIVGETKIRRNKMVPIICTPTPTTILRTSLETYLKKGNNLVSLSNNADKIIRITLLNFSVKESYNKITQTMEGAITLSVSITTTDSTYSQQQFSLTTGNSYTTLDTSKHAERVLRGALMDAIRNITKKLSSDPCM